MNNKKRTQPTVYDIAAAAGVSPATVSRTLNGNCSSVAADTREHVLKIAAELGYLFRPSKTPPEAVNHVHVIIPDLVNPFYSALIAGLESALRSYELQMVLHVTNGSLRSEMDILSAITQKNHINVIIAPATNEIDHISTLADQHHEVVMIEHTASGKYSSIRFNSYQGARMATEFLAKRGAHRIAFFSPALTRATRINVYNGFIDAMHCLGLPIEDSLVILADSSATFAPQYAPDFGAALCETMIQHNPQLPDAIFCENDMIAIGVIHCLQKRGIRVPEDISVIGLDNIALGAMILPPLTTIDQCTYEMGALAAELIHTHIHAPSRKRVQLLLEPQLVLRESVK